VAQAQWSRMDGPREAPIRRLWTTADQLLLEPDVEAALEVADVVGFAASLLVEVDDGDAVDELSFAVPLSFAGLASFVALGADELDE